MAKLKDWLRAIVQFLNGFRKFIIMLTLILVGVIFRLSGHFSGAETVDLLRYTAIAFFAGNGLEHMTKAVVEWVKGKAQ